MKRALAGAGVSVMIFTRDEEIHLPSCLAALGWCDDVIVVDSFSTDGTELLCRRGGVHFFQHRFTGFGDQRSWALEHCRPKHPWVLILDADERVTPELADEIRSRLQEVPPEIGAFRIRRRFHLWGRWLRYSSLYPTWVVRLVHRDRVRFTNQGHAETQQVQGGVASLEHDLMDENLKGIEAWFHRQESYASRDAEFELSREGTALDFSGLLARDPLRRRVAWKRLSARLPFRPALYFAYSFLLRGGFRDGALGWRFCLMRARYQGMVARKKKQLRQERAMRPRDREAAGRSGITG
jgi:glycosyltransferase involved in cell wall biosynthesis